MKHKFRIIRKGLSKILGGGVVLGFGGVISLPKMYFVKVDYVTLRFVNSLSRFHQLIVTVAKMKCTFFVFVNWSPH